MTIENLKKVESPSKTNKWDRIKRKYSSNVNLTSETVKKFLEMEFINDKNMKFMKGDPKSCSMDALNPQLIMDLRHDLIRSKTRESSAKAIQYRDFQVENAKKHNELVELRMIENELNKFKSKITSIKSKKQSYNIDFLEEEDKKILQVLRDSEQLIRELDQRKNSIDMKMELPPIETNRSSSESPDNKNVHFGNTIKVITYPKSASNMPPIPKEESSTTSDTEFGTELDADHDNDDNYFKDFDSSSSPSNESVAKDCHVCYPNEDDDYLDFESRHRKEFDIQSFHSLPNLSDAEVDSFLKISKFQSIQNFNDQLIDECPCCLDYYDHNQSGNQNHEIKIQSTKVKTTQQKFDCPDTNNFLLVKRMEIEEKNFSQLIVCNNSNFHEETNRAFSDFLSMASTQETEEEIIHIDLDKEVLRIYFQKWWNFTTIQKIIKTNAFTNEDRVKKINNFLNKIRIEQNKNKNKSKTAQQRRHSNGSIFTKLETKKVKKDYEHKLKVQQDIIELQKLKLERQERMITELKLAKFSEMLKESKNDLKNQLKTAVTKGSIRLRTKARCIQLAANIRSDPEEDEKRKLLAQGLIVPKFLAKMQERAAERLQRHEDARQRRIRLEQEKEELKNAAELAKREEDEKARQQRLREMREKRRKEKIMKLIKEQERQQYLENLKKAREHYSRKLLKNVGFMGFHLLIKLKRTNHKKATLHRRRTCMKRYFEIWAEHTKQVWQIKREKANEHHERCVIKRYFAVWCQVYKIRQSRLLVAVDWYEMKITEKLLKQWHIRMKQNQLVESGKMKSAETHYNCQMKWKVFDHWRRLPAIMKIEKETEVRRQKWRLKIMDILTDYNGI